MQDAVTICMCTFRRESAFAALDSFSGLEGTGELPVEVLIIDNDETDALQTRFEAYAANFPFPLRYVHAPARNISIARNAALTHARTRWLAFIDDDEVATPDWLKHLAMARNRTDVVIGRCEAVYGPDLPAWVRACDFHSNRIRGNPTNAYTSNALIDRDFLLRHGIRFRIELGRTGGRTLFSSGRSPRLGDASFTARMQ
ncbi:glycosyltransferase family 2 protein [Blastomonas aquatica]|uniref:glycosyltransferase family 2 protein n=1 Tax=Blastomonas aquatica TaxID=1510276 RepID=UPI00362426B4